MELANRIRKIREAKKLTQADIADKCNMSTSAYSKIERSPSNSSYHTLTKIANALEVDLTFLIDISNPNYTVKKTTYRLLSPIVIFFIFT